MLMRMRHEVEGFIKVPYYRDRFVFPRSLCRLHPRYQEPNSGFIGFIGFEDQQSQKAMVYKKIQIVPDKLLVWGVSRLKLKSFDTLPPFVTGALAKH